MKRTISTIKQFDYTSKEEFEKDIKSMKEKGYTLINNGMFNNSLTAGKITGDDKWKYTGYFIQSKFM